MYSRNSAMERVRSVQQGIFLRFIILSIEADQGGTPHARARVRLVNWEGRSHALLFMVPLGLPSARPMAQALRLPFGYLLLLLFFQ